MPKKNKINDPMIISMAKGFHGHTLATTNAAGIDFIKAGFEPLLPTFSNVAFNDLKALEKMIMANPNVIGIFLEPIQGDGGIRVPEPHYLHEIRKLCNQHHLLMILDEIQCGLGRTGKWGAFEYENSIPDILTIAKPLANGLPIGACLVKGPAADLFKPGQQASTFAGSPLICALALTILQEIEQKNILKNVIDRGEH